MADLASFKAWVLEQQSAIRETLAMFETGQLHIFQNERDISEGHMRSLRLTLQEIEDLLAGNPHA